MTREGTFCYGLGFEPGVQPQKTVRKNGIAQLLQDRITLQDIEVTKIIEWDMGHRVPNHKNKCRHPHGHRYRLELTLNGAIRNVRGDSDEGMVLDFGEIKSLMTRHIHDELDHGFMISENDPFFSGFAREHAKELLFILVPFIPTSENIIRWCYEKLRDKIPQGVRISRLRLYETPNSWADFHPQDTSPG